MSQGFQAGKPGTNTQAASLEVRGSLQALLTNHFGTLPPNYLVQGSTYFGQPHAGHSWPGGGHLHVVKRYDSQPYGLWGVGGAGLVLYSNPWLPGADATAISPQIRIATDAFLGSQPGIVELAAGDTELNITFNASLPPSFHAARDWEVPEVAEPALYSADGVLLGKVWDTIPGGNDFIDYATGSPNQLLNGPAYPENNRLVDVEQKTNRYQFATTTGQDHVRIPGSDARNQVYWWEVQQGLLNYEIYEAGVIRDPRSYKVVAVTTDGANVDFIVYNRNLSQTDLVPFADGARLELRFNKGT